MQQVNDLLETQRILATILPLVPKLTAALLVLLVFWLLYRSTRRPLSAVLRRAQVHEALIRLLVDSVYRISLLALALLMAASQLGINVAAAIAGIGVVGVALGLAAQDTVANMIAGFVIFWDKPFSVGDFLTVAERFGEVREITLRTTRIRTPDNTYVVIPNRQIMDGVLVNYSMYGETRINVPIGIAYKEFIPQAREVLTRAAGAVEGVLSNPAPDVVVISLSGSSVELTVRVWTDDMSRERVIFYRTLEVCKLALDEAGIQIPYPHLQLFVENVDDRVWGKAAALAAGGGQAL